MSKGLLRSGLKGARSIVTTGRKHQAINISCERYIRRGYRERERWRGRMIVEETAVYEMACDFPRTDADMFGNGEYYAEEETTGAWWLFDCAKNAKAFISKEFSP